MASSPASNLEPIFDAAAAEWNLDPRLLRAVAGQESGATRNPDRALSSAGAMGRMQIMPDTARELGVTDPHDPVQSIYGGAKYLSQMLDRYGNPEHALAAYNAGPGRVDAYLAGRGQLPAETVAYVPAVTRRFQALGTPAAAPVQRQAALPPQQAPAPSADDPFTAALGAARTATGNGHGSTPDPFGQALGGARQGAGSDDPFGAALASAREATTPQAQVPQPPATATPQPSAPAPVAPTGPLAAADAADADPLGGVVRVTPAGQAAVRAMQGAPNPASGLLAGLDRGVQDVGDTGAKVANALAPRIAGLLPEGVVQAGDRAAAAIGMPATTAGQLAQASADMDTERHAYDAANTGWDALAGRVLGNVLATGGPANALIRPVGAVGGMLREAAAGVPILNRLVALGTRAGEGAAGGAASAALTSGGNDAPLSDQMQTGALFGGALGGAGSLMRGAAGALAPQMPAEMAALYQRARDLGINLSGWRVNSSPTVQKLGDMADAMPGSGAAQAMDQARSQFTRALSNLMGADAARLTPDVVQGIERRVGNEFDRVAANTTIGPQQTNALTGRLAQIENDAARLTPDEFHVVRQHLNDVLNAAAQGNGTIPGNVYQALTRQGTPLMNAASSANPNIARAAGAIRTALDDGLEGSASPQMAEALRQARYQWMVLRTAEPLIEKAQLRDFGLVNPMLLAERLRGTDERLMQTGGGALGDLARIGQLFRSTPNSGTPAGMLALNAMGSLGTAGGALVAGQPLAAAAIAGNAAAPFVAGPGISRLMRSAPYTNLLLYGSPAAPGTGANALLNAVGANAAPAAAQVGNRLLPQPQLVPAPVL